MGRDTDASQVCDSVLRPITSYDHASTKSWNTNIISIILQKLIHETSSSSGQPSHKFAVNSTIIQHAFGPRVEGKEENGGVPHKKGMHSASGAYWNNETDGIWSFKYDKSESKGFNVVISIIWVSLS